MRLSEKEPANSLSSILSLSAPLLAQNARRQSLSAGRWALRTQAAVLFPAASREGVRRSVSCLSVSVVWSVCSFTFLSRSLDPIPALPSPHSFRSLLHFEPQALSFCQPSRKTLCTRPSRWSLFVSAVSTATVAAYTDRRTHTRTHTHTRTYIHSCTASALSFRPVAALAAPARKASVCLPTFWASLCVCFVSRSIPSPFPLFQAPSPPPTPKPPAPMDLKRDYPFIQPDAAAKAVDGVSELAVLRSRVEQQAELIALLQRRADDEGTQHKATKAELEELRRQCVSADRRRQTAEDERARLLKQFETLSANHREIIAFKDEHKRTAEALRQRNAKLEAEGQAQAEARRAAVEDATAALRQEVEALQREVARLRALLAEAEATQKSLEEQLQKTSRELETLGGAKRSESARAASAKREAARLAADVESYKSQLTAAQDEARQAAKRALTAEGQLEAAQKVGRGLKAAVARWRRRLSGWTRPDPWFHLPDAGGKGGQGGAGQGLCERSGVLPPCGSVVAWLFRLRAGSCARVPLAPGARGAGRAGPLQGGERATRARVYRL